MIAAIASGLPAALPASPLAVPASGVVPPREQTFTAGRTPAWFAASAFAATILLIGFFVMALIRGESVSR